MSSVWFWLSCHEVEEMPNGHWSYQLLFLSRFRVAKGATVHYSDEHSHRIHTLSDTLCLAARKLLSLYTLQAELAPVRSTVFLACNPWKRVAQVPLSIQSLQSGVINPRHLVVPHLPARVSIF